MGKNADYIAMDMHSSLDLYPSLGAYCDQINQLLTSPDYGLTTADDGLLVFRRGAPDAAAFTPMAPCP